MKRIPLLTSLALLGLAACGEAPTDLDPEAPPVAESRTGEVLSGLSPMERAEPTASPWAEDVQIDAAAFASPAALTLTGDVTLTFDDIPVGADNDDVITDEYAADGVTWVTDDGVVREGLSQGDPGNWGLEGTNGPQFLGFNGTSYTGTMVFSDNVSQVTLDASRSNGSEDGDVLEVEAFCEGASVDATTVVFGPINDWSTAMVAAACIDEVTLTGTGAAFHPYGVDNVLITFEPLDEDGDGLSDEDDLCAGTVVPDPVIPTEDLGRNRFALVDGDDVFDTNRPSPRAPLRVYTLEDTGGCNAGQIADALGLGQNQYRSGLTVGTMERWVSMVAEGAVAP